MMYDNYTINRCDAMEWLAKNLVEWPMEIVGGETEIVSMNMFNGWYFIQTMSGDIIFADCLLPCITETDFYNFLYDYAGTEITRFGDSDEK